MRYHEAIEYFHQALELREGRIELAFDSREERNEVRDMVKGRRTIYTLLMEREAVEIVITASTRRSGLRSPQFMLFIFRKT